MTLQTRLLAAGLLLIALVLGIAVLSYVHGREQALLNAEDNTEDLARALEQHTLTVVRGIDRTLAVLRERIDVDALDRPERRQSFHELLDRWARADPALASFIILDEHGTVLHRSDTAER